MNASNTHTQVLRPTGRIAQLDIARGLAVVLMVVGHSIDAVLAPGPRLTEAFRLYDSLRGLTAPLFLLLAGFAFTVATVKHWDDHARFGPRTARRLLRAALLLGVGYTLHLPFFSFGKLLLNATPDDYARFLQADILQCVALSLAALQLTVLIAGTPARHLRLAFALGILIAASSPLVWTMNLDGLLPRAIIPYLNQQYRTLFPLLPYAAYMFVGAGLGHTYLLARKAGSEQRWYRRMIVGAVLLIGAGLAGGFLPWTVYPVHDFWKTNPGMLAVRAGVVMAVVTALLRLQRFPPKASAVAMLLGQSSLFVYVAHLIVVYGSVANPGLAHVLGQDLSISGAIAVALGVLVVMTGLAFVFRFLRGSYGIHLRIAQAGVATLLMYLFVTLPY
jgi:acyltransferase